MGYLQTYLNTLKRSRTLNVQRLPLNALTTVPPMTVRARALAVMTTHVALRARLRSIPPPSAP